jgi:hypothetical protein
VTVALVARDLMMATRVADAAARAGVELRRFDDPSQLPPAHDISVLLVAWDERRPDWAERLAAWCAAAPQSATPRVVLFGPHTDLPAHAEARAAGLGPMWARSKLVAELDTLVR